jgi:RNA polymerase sigma-70 factor (ECF subfamily)
MTDAGVWDPGALFALHHDRILRTAYRITGSITDAEDVLQTVFMRLLRRQAAIPPGGDPGAYLRLSAVNGALDLVRSRRGPRPVPLEDAERDGAIPPGTDPETARASQEMREMVRAAVARLGGRAAEVFVLRYFEGCGNQEIARMLGTSEGVVAVTVHRARQKLREEIGSMIGDKP